MLQQRGVAWCFTLNAAALPDEPEEEGHLRGRWKAIVRESMGGQLERLRVMAEEQKAKLFVAQVERGERKTFHVQGYVHWGKTLSGRQTKALIGGEAHVERARGKPRDSLEYCTKVNNGQPGDLQFEPVVVPEAGEWPERGQGARNDLYMVWQCLREGKGLLAIGDEYPGAVIKYQRSLDGLAMRMREPADNLRQDVRVWVVSGPTGIGKSWRAATIPGAYRWTSFCPWEQYAGENVVVLDDMDWNKVDYLRWMEWVDCYKTQVRVLYGTRWLVATKFIITSNEEFGHWWPAHNPQHTAALRRRVTKEYKCESREDVGRAYDEIIPQI